MTLHSRLHSLAQVIWSGVPTRSPVFEQPYPIGSIRAIEEEPGRFVFHDLLLKKGETTIVLKWVGAIGTDNPDVSAVNIDFKDRIAP